MIYLLLKKAYQASLIMSAILLMGCSISPTSVQLEPDLWAKQTGQTLQSQLTWQLSSQDQRTAHYLIEIIEGNNAARLINESQSSRLIIEKALQQQWIKKGLAIQANGANSIDIQLIRLLVNVEQNSVTYNSNSQIVIAVKLQSEGKAFSKTFKSRFSKEGVLTADVKAVSERLNDQLSQLLYEILQDAELNAKLQKF